MNKHKRRSSRRYQQNRFIKQKVFKNSYFDKTFDWLTRLIRYFNY